MKMGGVRKKTLFYQPLYANENLIGKETVDPAFSNSKCTFRTRRRCRWSDSAFAQMDARVPASDINQGGIVAPQALGSITTTARAYRITAEAPSNALMGETLNKVGRTTGWSQGEVILSCVNVRIFETNIVLLCQDIVGAAVAPGDSGSPVFKFTNNPSAGSVTLHGILWGGTSDDTEFVFSPIANIQRAGELGPLTTCAAGFAC